MDFIRPPDKKENNTLNCSRTLLGPLFAIAITAAMGQDSSTLELVKTIPLPLVNGRIDHMAFDIRHGRLLVAALGNGSVEVVGLKEGKVIHSIRGLHEPQGIVCLPDMNTIVVASGGDGVCSFLDAESFQPAGTISLGDDADNIRYDDTAHLLYVGYGSGALAVIDPSTKKKLADIPLAGHPESFQLEQNGGRLFVNIPQAEQIAIVQRASHNVVGKIDLRDASGNFPMAVDQKHHRLFVGCRDPARLLILTPDSGSVRTVAVDIDGDCDDVFFDETTRAIYISCGEGFLDIITRTPADKYVLTSRIKTSVGARTSLFVPELHHLFVAVPRRGSRSAAVRIYHVKE